MLFKMNQFIANKKINKLKMSEVIVCIAVVVIISFNCVSINISLNLISFMIKNRLKYCDCAYEFFKNKTIKSSLSRVLSLFILTIVACV